MLRSTQAEQVYYILGMISTLADNVMFTVMSVYFVTTVRMNPLQLVLVGTALEGTVLLFEVPTGVVADTFSRRLSVQIGMAILGVGFLVVGAVPHFPVIVLAQVVCGLGYTFLSGALDAWLADEVGEQRVGRVYLRGGQLNRLAGLVGTGLSVALASWRLNVPLLVGGTLYAGLALFLLRVMPEQHFRPAPRAERTTWQHLGTTWRGGTRVLHHRPLLLTLLVIGLFAGAASEGFDRLGEAHLLQNFTFPSLGALQPVVWFGLLNVMGSLVSLGVTEGLRPRLETASRRPATLARILLACNTLTVAGALGFALAGNFWAAVAALLAKRTVGALSTPLYNTWLVRQIDPQVRATVLSMISQSDALGQVLGGPGLGAIGTAVSLRAALVTAGALLAPISGLYVRAGQAPPTRADSS